MDCIPVEPCVQRQISFPNPDGMRFSGQVFEPLSEMHPLRGGGVLVTKSYP